MPTVSQVATPPAKPVMLFDGNCGFCAFWIRRWQQATGERVEYIPFQDTRTAEWFPELPREQLALAVHLIESNGAVCRGAEAVCRSLATNPARQWPLRWYQKCPRFAAMAESAYRFVAGHRPLFAALTHALWPQSKRRNADNEPALRANPHHKTAPMHHTATEQFVSGGKPHSLARFLDPLHALPGVQAETLGPFDIGGQTYSLPKFTFRGPNASDPIRIGIFAAIHGDEPAGATAAASFLRDLAAHPALAENFLVHVYPLCNPTGFEDNTRVSRRDRDLNREFWKSSPEQEVQLLEYELRTQHFSGIIQLHADDTSDGVYGFVRGHTLTEHLLRPALRAAEQILPRNINAAIDGFAARDGIIYESYDGVLAAPVEMEPIPFEIILETPHHAPLDRQVEALVAALHTILTEYRLLISLAQNI